MISTKRTVTFKCCKCGSTKTIENSRINPFAIALNVDGKAAEKYMMICDKCYEPMFAELEE